MKTKTHWRRFIVVSLLIGLISACAAPSRYSMKHDVGPIGSFDASQVPDAVPVWEPLSRQGNASSYTVRGVKYHLADVSSGFEEVGIASWYGLKFHGELTSNGEVYNMYAMSAAHKHLPLPGFVRVTNLENNKQIVVRVNDRGPFHKGRVIDLSYAAATKLGFVNHGTAKVKVELIKPPFPGGTESDAHVQDKIMHFIQIAAFSSRSAAADVSKSLTESLNSKNIFVASDQLTEASVHRVRAGPFVSETQAKAALKNIKSRGYSGAIIIQRALSAKNI